MENTPLFSLKHLIYLRLSLQRASKLPPFWRDHSYLVHSVLFSASVGLQFHLPSFGVIHTVKPPHCEGTSCVSPHRGGPGWIQRCTNMIPSITSSEFNRRAGQTTSVLQIQNTKQKQWKRCAKQAPVTCCGYSRDKAILIRESRGGDS